MPFTHIIAHRVTRPSPQDLISLQARDALLPLDGKTQDLAFTLKQAYLKKTGKAYGRFSSDTAAHPLSQWLRQYREEKLSFASFTHSALTHLKLEVEKTQSLLHGHVFFMLEALEAATYLYILVVEHDTGLYFDGNNELSDSLYLDTQKFTLAARISLQEWEQEEKSNYISLVRWRGEKDLSDAFAQFIGFTDKIDQKAQTQELIEIVDAYADNLDPSAASHTRQSLVSYCLEQAKQDKPVLIEDLSQHLDTERAPEISQFIKSHSQHLQDDVIPDTGALRNFVRLSGRNEQMSMSFASDCLGNTVVYDPESDSLIIKSIPPALKSRLLKLLKKQG
jgi:nucleoid-associated protein